MLTSRIASIGVRVSPAPCMMAERQFRPVVQISQRKINRVYSAARACTSGAAPHQAGHVRAPDRAGHAADERHCQTGQTGDGRRPPGLPHASPAPHRWAMTTVVPVASPPENGHGDEHQQLAEAGGGNGGGTQAAGQEDIDNGNQALEEGGEQHRHGETKYVTTD